MRVPHVIRGTISVHTVWIDVPCVFSRCKLGCYKHHPAANEMHEMSWSEMQRIYEWVVETKGYRPLVIDADDLQRDPGKLGIATGDPGGML